MRCLRRREAYLVPALFFVIFLLLYDFIAPWSALPKPELEPLFVGSVGTVSFSDYQYGNVVLLGNSVTRHYAFKLCYGIGFNLERRKEKKICESEIGVSSCDLYCNGGRIIRFHWANMLGSESSTDPRDVCLQYATIEKCFFNIFSNTTENDLLIIGSIPIEGVPTNVSKQIWDKPFDTQVPAWHEYLNASNIAVFLPKILKYFPGNVRWHSFPFLKIDADTKGNMLQKHLAMLREINDVVAQAIASVNNPRLRFLDVWELQKQNLGEYTDLIHHPGNISETIVGKILQSLDQSEGFEFESYTHLHSQSTYSNPAIIYQCPSGYSVEWGQYKGTPRGGFSDHQAGVISTFLVSLLLQMPFFIDCHIFSDVYKENTIKWKWPNAGQYSVKHGPVKYLDKYGSLLSVSDINRGVQNVVQSNRGIIGSLNRQELAMWNLTHQNSFSSVHRYLFRTDRGLPKQGVKNKSIPMITMQLRLGDGEIYGNCKNDKQECQYIQDTRVQRFISCISTVQRMYNISTYSLFILSDCDCLKKLLKSYFESTLDIEVLLEEAPSITANDYNKKDFTKSFVGALEIASRADFFIITQNSGVGRQIVARAQRFNKTFWGHMGDQCVALDFDAIAEGWSGL